MQGTISIGTAPAALEGELDDDLWRALVAGLMQLLPDENKRLSAYLRSGGPFLSDGGIFRDGKG